MVASSRPGNRTQLTPATRAGITRGPESVPANHHRGLPANIVRQPSARRRIPCHTPQSGVNVGRITRKTRVTARFSDGDRSDTVTLTMPPPIPQSRTIIPESRTKQYPVPDESRTRRKPPPTLKPGSTSKVISPRSFSPMFTTITSHSQMPSPHRGDQEALPTIRRARGRCENRTHPRAPAANGIRAAHQSRPSPITARAPD